MYGRAMHNVKSQHNYYSITHALIRTCHSKGATATEESQATVQRSMYEILRFVQNDNS